MDAKNFMARAVRMEHPRQAPRPWSESKRTHSFKMVSDGGCEPLWEPSTVELAVEFDVHQLLMMGIEPA